MGGKLTNKDIKAAKPAAARYKMSAGDGFYLVVPTTGTKWWRLDYRFGGKQQSISLGLYDEKDNDLATARDKAIDCRRLIKKGINPSAERKAEARNDEPLPAVAFGQIADAWLKTRTGGSSKTYDRDERMVKYLKEGKENAEGFGQIDVEKVELGHLLPLLKVVNHPTRIRLVSTARKIIGYARVHGAWPKDRPSPFADLDFGAGFAKHKEKHRPAITDPIKFGQLLRKIELYEGRGDNLIGYALELLALTFVRPGTVQSARWCQFDLDGGLWIVPFERLKMATERSEAGKSEDDYIIPLSKQAVKLLRELRKITGDGEYLFPGRAGRTISENTLNLPLHVMGYKDIHCAHGFRSSASTMLNRERINGRRRFERDLIEMQQDRLDSSTRAIYDRDDRLPERIELMQFWADKIDQMRSSTIMALKVA